MRNNRNIYYRGCGRVEHNIEHNINSSKSLLCGREVAMNVDLVLADQLVERLKFILYVKPLHET